MEEKSPPDPPVCQLPELSPVEVHKNILRCYRLRNRLDRKLLGWILVLIEKRYAPALGSPDPLHYIMKHLQLEKSEAYEVLGVARALPLIPLSLDAFEKGEISWSKLKQIALMAKEEREEVVITSEEMVKGEALPEGEINDLDVPEDVEMKVLARFDHSCARCGRRIDLHIHHLIFRSKGGPNEVWNLAPLCEMDHACVHGGTLEVFMDSLGELHWRSKADRIELILGDEMKELASVPPVVIAVEGKGEAGRDSASPETEVHEEPAPQPQVRPAPSNGTQPAKVSRESEGVAEALQKLGYEKKAARGLVLKALAILSDLGRAPTGDEILNTALHGQAVVLGEGKFRRCGKAGPVESQGEDTLPKPREPLEPPEPGDAA